MVVASCWELLLVWLLELLKIASLTNLLFSWSLSFGRQSPLGSHYIYVSYSFHFLYKGLNAVVHNVQTLGVFSFVPYYELFCRHPWHRDCFVFGSIAYVVLMEQKFCLLSQSQYIELSVALVQLGKHLLFILWLHCKLWLKFRQLFCLISHRTCKMICTSAHAAELPEHGALLC